MSKKTPSKGGRKGRKAASPKPSSGSSEMKEEAETDVSESESGEESGLEDVIVVRGGGGLEISRTPPP